MTRLDRELVRTAAFQARADLDPPAPELLELPERVAQFGTGAFLRGFVDYFIDAANRGGHFGGRVVMIGSTGSGRDRRLNEQDGLYTLSMQGVSGGTARREHRVIGSVSRALSAVDEWDEVLAVARDPRIELVFSNTTEVGIALDPEDRPDAEPPRSFPGKLARFLLERGRAFSFDPERGVVVIPCELIEDNGARLREIVLAHAQRWGVEPEFARWLEEAVPFCNTLVDRIVPGAPAGEQRERLVEELGYEDEMLTVAEVYRLFAIEAPESARGRLGFTAADPGIVLVDSAAPYRERKVRLLNGTHTLLAPLALLVGCETVRETVEHPEIGRYLRSLLFDEMPITVDAPDAEEYAREVYDRFANPYVRHALWDITLHGTTKMRVRVVPAIVRHVERVGRVPRSLALGFAAYLLFLRGDLHDTRRAAGLPVPPDELAEPLRARWMALPPDADPADLVRAVCSDESLWGTDLTAVPGFAEAVAAALEQLVLLGPVGALAAHLEEMES